MICNRCDGAGTIMQPNGLPRLCPICAGGGSDKGTRADESVETPAPVHRITGRALGQIDWMQTFTGRQFRPLAPKAADVDLRDIAHALAMHCRYGGHCPRFYSVAQHSVHVAEILPAEWKVYGLLHDAAEAYIGDAIRPIKSNFSAPRRNCCGDRPRAGLCKEYPMSAESLAASPPPPLACSATASLRVLVTGGAGFIGRAVCARLQAAGHDVAAFDLVPCQEPGINTVLGSVMDWPALEQLAEPREAAPEVLIHCAAVLGVRNTDRRPRYTLDINIGGTRMLCDLAQRIRAKRLIYLSSSEVYGEARTPTAETEPIAPISVYGVSKAAGEAYVRALGGDVPWTILRPFNVYGGAQREDFVVARFLRQALSGQEITVYGGDQRRAFCHIDDLARAVVDAVERPEAANATLNIGNPSAFVSIRHLAEMVDRIAGAAGSRIVDAPLDRAMAREIRIRLPDVSLAERLLGWQPEIGLERGLRMIVDEMREEVARE